MKAIVIGGGIGGGLIGAMIAHSELHSFSTGMAYGMWLSAFSLLMCIGVNALVFRRDKVQVNA